MLSTKPKTAAIRPSLVARAWSACGALGDTTSTRLTKVCSGAPSESCHSFSFCRMSSWASTTIRAASSRDVLSTRMKRNGPLRPRSSGLLRPSSTTSFVGRCTPSCVATSWVLIAWMRMAEVVLRLSLKFSRGLVSESGDAGSCDCVPPYWVVVSTIVVLET